MWVIKEFISIENGKCSIHRVFFCNFQHTTYFNHPHRWIQILCIVWVDLRIDIWTTCAGGVVKEDQKVLLEAKGVLSFEKEEYLFQVLIHKSWLPAFFAWCVLTLRFEWHASRISDRTSMWNKFSEILRCTRWHSCAGQQLGVVVEWVISHPRLQQVKRALIMMHQDYPRFFEELESNSRLQVWFGVWFGVFKCLFWNLQPPKKHQLSRCWMGFQGVFTWRVSRVSSILKCSRSTWSTCWTWV